ncbi:MAG: hypothetical protein HY606_00400, partial [Planctomycetes bacterium]|nr:hypothetical protein [Planctomycetota bacterium]
MSFFGQIKAIILIALTGSLQLDYLNGVASKDNLESSEVETKKSSAIQQQGIFAPPWWGHVFSSTASMLSSYVKTISSPSGFTTVCSELGKVAILKLDHNGNLQAARRIGASGQRLFVRGATKTPDGGCLVLITNQLISTVFFLTKLDSEGRLQAALQYSYPGTGGFFSDMKPTSDGGVVFCANYNSIIKIGSGGEVLFAKKYTANIPFSLSAVTETSDGSYVAVGSTMVVNNTFDWFLMKIDSSGNLVYTTYTGGPNFDIGTDIIENSVSRELNVVGSVDFGSGSDILLMRVASNLTTIGAVKYGGTGSDDSPTIKQTSINGNLLISWETTVSSSGTDYEYLLLKTDWAGNLIYQNIYGSSPTNQLACVTEEVRDGNYVLSGISMFDIAVLKVRN